MNLESRHFINGIEIRPKNGDDIGLKLDWSGETKEAELNTDSIILDNLAKKLVLDHVSQFGVFEGIPYTFMVGTFSLDYYIDLTENPIMSGKGDSSIEVTIKRRKAIDWFKQQANGTSFELVNKETPFSLIDVPYLIVKDNQMEVLIMLLITTYTLTKALIEGIRDIAKSIDEITRATVPNIGIPPSYNTGAIIGAVLLGIARVIYVIALIVALIDMTKQIIELIFPPIRKFKGVTVLELMKKSSAKFGLTFQSSIIQNMSELAIVGVPLKKDKENILTKLFTLTTGYFNKGYPTARDSVNTFGRLVDALEMMFNAKFRIVGNNLIFERRDYWVLNSGVTINNTLNLQSNRENQWSFNLADSWKRYYMHYQYDISDWHTMNILNDTDCEYSTEPVSYSNLDLVSIKGLVDIPIPFSFGTRKDELSYVEEACIPFVKRADNLINFIGGNASLEAKVKGRVGVMMVGQAFFTKTKLIYQTGGKQPVNYRGIIGANALYNNYHVINQVKQNFKRIYNETIAFSTQQFLTLLENNFVTDQNGISLEILTFEWINESKTAEITYAILSDEGFNTKTILIDG